MKFFLVLFSICLICSARPTSPSANNTNTTDYLDMLCIPQNRGNRKDKQLPFAVVNYNLEIVSFSSPEPVDVFLTASDDGKITTWYTFPQREPLGVDANGTLELKSENVDTTFRILNPLGSRFYPYTFLCATRSQNDFQSHFILSMNSSATSMGFQVEHCNNSTSLHEFWSNAEVEQYLHTQLQYSNNLYLAREKCKSVRARCPAPAEAAPTGPTTTDM